MTTALDIISTAFAGFGMRHDVCDGRAETLVSCLSDAGWAIVPKTTTAALRSLAIIPTMAHGYQNQVVNDGYRCRICRSTFKIGASEVHSPGCVLKGTTP